MKYSKEMRSDNAGSEIQMESKRNQQRNSWLRECWHYHCCACNVQPEGLREGGLTDIHEEKQLSRRCPRGSDAGKTLHIEELSDIFHNIKSIKDKKLEADPGLERSVPNCQGPERCLLFTLQIKLSCILRYMKRHRQTLLKLLLISFLQRSKQVNTLILNVSTVLNCSVLKQTLVLLCLHPPKYNQQ